MPKHRKIKLNDLKIKIGNKKVGDDEPTFIIAEMGINHNGDLSIAKKMVDVAVECGADAVKTQKRNVREVFTQEVIDSVREDGRTYYEYKNGIELSKEDFRSLAKYCESRGIMLLASPWDYESADLVNEVVPAHKIASPLLTDLPFIDYITQMGKPMIVSTGMSSMKEVRDAVDVIKKHTSDIVLMHCASLYPIEPEQGNLRVMETLKKEFGLPVGFSSHEKGIWMSEAAVAIGAVAVERHFTLNRAMPGSDQAASLEPQGLKKLIRDIRGIERAMGSPEKTILKEEMPLRMKLSKSIVAKGDIPKGTTLTRDMLTTKSPGNGLPPSFLYKGWFDGKRVKKDIKKDDFVMLEDSE